MNRLFNMDNKFFTFMGRVADLMILNVIFLICCIPIITIGDAIVSMHYVTLKMTRNEEAYIIRSFFKSFKENFKQATIIWLIMLATGLLLRYDFFILSQMEGTVYTVFLYLLFMITIVYALVLLYIFPVLSKFYNSIPNTFKNSLLMSIRHLPKSILMMLITFVPLGVTLLSPMILVYGFIIWILIGFSFIAFLNSKLLVNIFDCYIPEEQSDKDLESEEATF